MGIKIDKKNFDHDMYQGDVKILKKMRSIIPRVCRFCREVILPFQKRLLVRNDHWARDPIPPNNHIHTFHCHEFCYHIRKFRPDIYDNSNQADVQCESSG